MKRQPSDMQSLVYAYGCGQPISGLEHAEAEQERCEMLWDRLVGIERDCDRSIDDAARRDDLRIDAALRSVAVIEAGLRSADKEARQRLYAQRLAAQRLLWPLLAEWRKAHKDTLREIELERRRKVIDARRTTHAWWPNYNAVIQRYETARIEVRRRGRALRQRNLERDDGCLTVQIQRTRSGLGAAPSELQDGTCSMLSIGRVPDAAYDAGTFRGERRRMCRTVVEMRVDCEGRMLRLPVWMHRPLPADCRVKQAQLVWRRRGERHEYQLCLTITRPAEQPEHPSRSNVVVKIDIAADRRGLQIATLHDADGLVSERVWLEGHWMAMMDRVNALQAVVKDDATPIAKRIRARNELPGLLARLLRQRREIYRLSARALASAYRRITLITPPLSEVAYAERGSEANALRHRACAHALVAEIRHQGRKHGSEVEIVLAEHGASAHVPRRVRRRRNKELGQPPAPGIEALANASLTV